MKIHHLFEMHKPAEGEAEVCDSILMHLTNAHRDLTRSDMFSAQGKHTLDMIYNSWRHDLRAGHLEAWHESYKHYSAHHTDAFDELVGAMFNSAGLGDHGTYNQFAEKVGLADFNMKK
jgi:hypothetical protein